MRYQITSVINKQQKVSVRCLDMQEEVWLKVSLSPDTLECMDKLIPDSLQYFIHENQETIRQILMPFYNEEEEVCIL